MRVGVQAADITPRIGMWMSGYGGRTDLLNEASVFFKLLLKIPFKFSALFHDFGFYNSRLRLFLKFADFGL